MKLKLLIDTSVWLDLARDYREQPVIGALDDLVKAGAVELIVPALVREEFARNRDRVAAKATEALQSHIRIVREAVTRFAPTDAKAPTLEALAEVDRNAFVRGEAVHDSLERVAGLLARGTAVDLNEPVKLRIADRALARLAPFHQGKLNTADAALIEMFAALAASDTENRWAFVTHNFRDFGPVEGDRREPHPDLAPLFDGERTHYFTTMIGAINWVDTDLLADHEFEFSYSEEPRRLSEILDAEHLLFRQVWYNRHWNLRIDIEEGRHHVVPEKDYSRTPYRQDQTLDTVWTAALAAAARTEKEVGAENLGPWTDFEWGMLNGKLSALRWVMGDEWDMLDT